jgi:hypothetical protein
VIRCAILTATGEGTDDAFYRNGAGGNDRSLRLLRFPAESVPFGDERQWQGWLAEHHGGSPGWQRFGTIGRRVSAIERRAGALIGQHATTTKRAGGTIRHCASRTKVDHGRYNSCGSRGRRRIFTATAISRIENDNSVAEPRQTNRYNIGYRQR